MARSIDEMSDEELMEWIADHTDEFRVAIEAAMQEFLGRKLPFTLLAYFSNMSEVTMLSTAPPEAIRDKMEKMLRLMHSDEFRKAEAEFTAEDQKPADSDGSLLH